MIEHKEGDIFTVESGIIMHGCNTLGVMGAGVAKTMREKYPRVYKGYNKFCGAAAEDRESLVGTVHFHRVTLGLIIANAFTQLDPGPDATLYAIRQCLVRVMQFGRENGMPVNSVMIGAGIGGLKWEDVYETYVSVDAFFPETSLIIWKYKP